MHRLCTTICFDCTFIAFYIPIPTHNRMLIMMLICHTPATFLLNIKKFSKDLSLTDTRRSKNIQKYVKFGWKTRTQRRLDGEDSTYMKKLGKSFYNACLVVTILVLMLKTLISVQISQVYKTFNLSLLWLKILDAPSKGDQINFKFLFIQLS